MPRKKEEEEEEVYQAHLQAPSAINSGNTATAALASHSDTATTALTADSTASLQQQPSQHWDTAPLQQQQQQ
ncbi:hypothetical protein MRB53_023286 [Persea americana]|uniref:Uncharacterized protein n=1 Tax=Persea americana TaxID=3435 RepID=A0ACC2L9I1_PERAE|nr:hypothetical protein MRB53_023286 [Persea americana]